MNFHVFDVDRLSKRILDTFWPNLGANKAENDPKMAPQNDPKSIKNRCRKMIKILIDSKRAIARRLRALGGGPADCAGLLGGIQGG